MFKKVKFHENLPLSPGGALLKRHYNVNPFLQKKIIKLPYSIAILCDFHVFSKYPYLSRFTFYEKADPRSHARSARARALRARAASKILRARARARSAKRQKMFIGSRAVSLTPANCDAKVRGRSCKRLKRRIAYVEKEMRKPKKIKSN